MASSIIGRDRAKVDIVVPESCTSVSRCHARLTPGDSGTLLIEDLDSRNGTYLLDGDDWQRISSATVEPGTIVRFGRADATGSTLQAAELLAALPGVPAVTPEPEKKIAHSGGPAEAFDVSFELVAALSAIGTIIFAFYWIPYAWGTLPAGRYFVIFLMAYLLGPPLLAFIGFMLAFLLIIFLLSSAWIGLAKLFRAVFSGGR